MELEIEEKGEMEKKRERNVLAESESVIELTRPSARVHGLKE